MRGLIPTAFAAFGLLAVGAAGATSTGSHFPLAAGNTWYLADAKNASASTVSVRTRSAGGLFLRGFPGTGDLRVRKAGEAVEAWDVAESRWEPFLRLGAAAGTRYKVDLARTGLWRNLLVVVASRQLEVEDARGRRFRGCVRLIFRNPKGLADAGLEELVFAPGVGLVRVKETTIAGLRTRLLDSFVPGATR